MEMLGQLVAGRYRLLRRLGAGGMGGVWLAHDLTDDRQVALKQCHLPDGLSRDEQDLFRVWTVREARAYSLVGHPNVVRTLDVLPDDDEPWIVMEYVESRSLQQIIDHNGPLPPPRVAGIGLAVLEALRAVRRAGLLHLDVKPSNVLVSHDGRVVLTDFGPAVTTEGVRALAGAGIVLGSPKYLAPERLIDGVAMPESDLWSLGATLYHAVEGRPPYVRATTTETLLAPTEGPPDPPRLAGPLTPVLVGLLRLDPARRLTADEVEAALREVIQQPAATPTPPVLAQPPARRRRHVALAGALAALVALVAVFAVVRPGREPAARPGTAAAPVAVAAALPPGFYWFLEGPGYRVGLPLDWPGSVTASGEFTAAPKRAQWPRLTIGVRPAPANVLAAFTAEELRTDLPGYRRIRIVQPPSAPQPTWEYTYQDVSSGLIRVERLALLDDTGERMFSLEWRTPRARWASDLPLFDQIVATFAAVPGG
ncbi:serine/threonine-protein kinase [Actinoplanes sp. CA-030573]|uniref:serine/threonine-protein kinase n=1 Tax=Actinoplanes sp. CA-030573 TaxID=3239898 RepID=UPI003D941A4A